MNNNYINYNILVIPYSWKYNFAERKLNPQKLFHPNKNSDKFLLFRKKIKSTKNFCSKYFVQQNFPSLYGVYCIMYTGNRCVLMILLSNN